MTQVGKQRQQCDTYPFEVAAMVFFKVFEMNAHILYSRAAHLKPSRDLQVICYDLAMPEVSQSVA